MNRARAAVLIAAVGGVVVVVGLLNVFGVIGPYRSNATVTSAEKAQIATYFLVRERFDDHHAKAGCPVDTLGAHRDGRVTTAYTVIHCWTGSRTCQPLSDATIGVVADLVDGRVRAERFDDAIDYAGGKSELSIYPRLLRGKAFDLMDNDGPTGFDNKAKLMAGCATH